MSEKRIGENARGFARARKLLNQGAPPYFPDTSETPYVVEVQWPMFPIVRDALSDDVKEHRAMTLASRSDIANAECAAAILIDAANYLTRTQLAEVLRALGHGLRDSTNATPGVLGERLREICDALEQA
jgi:hypothetical protein